MFDGCVKGEKLYIGEEMVLDVAGAPDGEVTVTIRPEGFELEEEGAFTLDLTMVEVMGRDITVVATHPACRNANIRAIISSDNRVDEDGDKKVRFALKPHKVFLFHKETEERIRFDLK